MTATDERFCCAVCRSVNEVGMIPHVPEPLCRECASEAQNTLIVRAQEIGVEGWDGPTVELNKIVNNMKEVRA